MLADDIKQGIEMGNEAKALAEPGVVARTVSSDTRFATIAFCSAVVGDLKEKLRTSVDGNISSTSWEGLDKPVAGYLSHNGSNIRLQTSERTVFDISMSAQAISEHALGMLITTPGGQYVVGNFTAVNDTLSPKEKMTYTFGGESTIWMRELANIGVVDKQQYYTTRNKRKLFTVFWFATVIIISLLFLMLSR